MDCITQLSKDVISESDSIRSNVENKILISLSDVLMLDNHSLNFLSSELQGRILYIYLENNENRGSV